jgi:outer membrane protein TolC
MACRNDHRDRPFLALTVLIAGFLLGANPPLPDPLDLRSALDAARTRNPDVRAAESGYLAMRERPSQEGTLPDPSLGIRYHNEDWDETFGESEFSFFEVSAEQEVPFPGKLSLRERIAEREAERERAMRDMTVLMVLAATASSYADLVVAERSAEILRESHDLLGLMIEQAAARYRVGEAAQQDVLRASLERGGLEERLAMVERRRLAAAASLASLLDLEPGAPLPRTADLPARSLEPLDVLAGKLAARSPTLRAAQEELLRSGEALRLARREYYPDFAVMASYMNKERLLPEWELGFRVSVPLYFWRRQRAAVAEAGYVERAAEREHRNTQRTLEARLADLHAMADVSSRLLRLYGDRLIPDARLTLESSRASYTVGRVDFLTMLTAFSALLEYELRYAEESGNLVRALAEIGPIVAETPLGDPLGRAP